MEKLKLPSFHELIGFLIQQFLFVVSILSFRVSDTLQTEEPNVLLVYYRKNKVRHFSIELFGIICFFGLMLLKNNCYPNMHKKVPSSEFETFSARKIKGIIAADGISNQLARSLKMSKFWFRNIRLTDYLIRCETKISYDAEPCRNG
jgi:hypothetical protein